MTLTELRYLLALAKEKHFGRAAQACFVSQPTLSVAIKKLEECWGVDLFERGKNFVSLTPIGENIVCQAARVIEEADKLKQYTQKRQDDLVGLLRVGAIYTVGPYLFPKMVSQLQSLAPKMPLLLQEDYTNNLKEKLHRAELDVIIAAKPLNDPQIQTQTLYIEQLKVIMPKAHPLTRKKILTQEDLKGETMLLLGAGHCLRDQVLETCPDCAKQLFSPDGQPLVIEGTSLETIRQMVMSGLGLSILPELAIPKTSQANTLICVKDLKKPAPSREIILAYRKRFSRPKAIDAIKAAILQGR